MEIHLKIKIKDVVGYDGYYQVSNLGNVKSMKRDVKYFSTRWKTDVLFPVDEKILKLSTTRRGFTSVHLKRNSEGKTISVARIVAEAFIPNPYNLSFVGYKDGNQKNNRAENLFWTAKTQDNDYSETPECVLKNETEEWRDVVGYEGLYEVSSFGNVRSIERINANNQKTYSKIKNIRKDRYGRLRTSLTKDGVKKTISIHRLVAMAFVDGYFEGATVNHKDENPCNNYYKNLEWMTKGNNNRYGTKARRTGDKNGCPVEQLTLEGKHIAFYKSIKDAARETGCCHSCISNVCHRKSKQSQGFLFRFV